MGLRRGQTQERHTKANMSEFEASARALEGRVGRKEDKYKKQKITVIKFKNRDSPTQVCFAALAR